MVLQVSRFRGRGNLLCGFPGGASGQELACRCRRHKHKHTWVGKVSWKRKWQPTPLVLPGNFHAQRGVAGYSPRGLRVRHDRAPEYTNASYYTTSPSSSWVTVGTCCSSLLIHKAGLASHCLTTYMPWTLLEVPARGSYTHHAS